MLDRLRDILSNILSRIVGALKSFEESSSFERGLRRYEALPPKRQQIVLNSMKIILMVLLAVIIVGPPFLLLSKIHSIRTLEQLEGSVIQFQNELETRLQGFAPPHGWKPLASNSSETLAAAFNEYMPSIGIPEDYGTMTASENSLNLKAHEISIRQAAHVLFELEGLFPKLQCTSWTVRVSANHADLVDVDGSFAFNPAFANQMAEGDDVDSTGPAPDAPEEVLPPTQQNPAQKNGTGKATSAPNDAAGYKGEYIPPNLPNSNDFEDFTPPEIPEELPPPPPPPGFEEEQQQ